MEQFRGFEDRALQARVERLRRSSRELAERVQTRMSQVEIERRWLRSDPLYQRLSAILKKVREDLADAERELSRRRGTSDVGEPVATTA